eukprot:Nitzschia sp. Nitz4//scaffold64_size103689//51574//53283//NITZ4_004436-RA/size103689-snap-gene-0.117-mRNA-1//1//CDS//3329556130//2712//frame0
MRNFRGVNPYEKRALERSWEYNGGTLGSIGLSESLSWPNLFEILCCFNFGNSTTNEVSQNRCGCVAEAGAMKDSSDTCGTGPTTRVDAPKMAFRGPPELPMLKETNEVRVFNEATRNTGAKRAGYLTVGGPREARNVQVNHQRPIQGRSCVESTSTSYRIDTYHGRRLRQPVVRGWNPQPGHPHRRFPVYSCREYSIARHSQPGVGGMVPIDRDEDSTPRHHQVSSLGSSERRVQDNRTFWSRSRHHPNLTENTLYDTRKDDKCRKTQPKSNVVVIPDTIIIPRELAPGPNNSSISTSERAPRKPEAKFDTNSPQRKRLKGNSEGQPFEGQFDKLNLLCSTTLGLGPLQDNPTGCSCPKSKCVALYCDCFKAGRRCSPNACTCLNCKNTVAESGKDGARTKAIQAILARNPRAFTNPGMQTNATKLAPGEQACNCVRSQCLKLYCACFQSNKVCKEGICSCVGCLNLADDKGGHRALAIQSILEKRPDAFEKPKAKVLGSGCACKNNKCIRKYCECFRTNLACTKHCSCRDCQNQSSATWNNKK